MNRKVLALLVSLAAGTFAAILFVPVTAQVVPVPEDDVKPATLSVVMEQLDRIESKIDKLQSVGTCPDCPTEANPPQPQETKKAEPAKEVVKVKYRSVSSPRWRINGKVWTRAEIVTHLLSHPEHAGSFKKDELEAMTLNQLWALHDDCHDAKQLGVVPVEPDNPTWDAPSGGCPGGVCPPQRRLLPRLFRRR